MKHSIDEIHTYIKMWYHDENWTDFNMAYDCGYTELACKLLVDAGAIDSSMCYEYAQSLEKAIEQLVKKYPKKEYKQDLKDVFDDAEVWVHKHSNKHAFIKNSDVDYLMDAKEMLEMGYIPSEEYYKEINNK